MEKNTDVTVVNTDEEALTLAYSEYEKFKMRQAEQPSAVEIHFKEALNQVKALERKKRIK